MRIFLLGNFKITPGSAPTSEMIGPERFRLRKARDLVKLLALAPQFRLHREELMELLWPENEPDAAANSLHQTLHAARQVLEALSPPCHLPLEDEWVCLRPEEGLWTDVEAFQQAARQASNSQDPAAWQAAINQYHGDLLPQDRYSGLFAQQRDALRQTYLTLLHNLACLYEMRAEYSLAATAFQKLVAADPTNEAAHTGLMRTCALLGQRMQALRQYQALQETLRRELDVEPSAESQRLYQQILHGEVVDRAAPAAAEARPALSPAGIPAATPSVPLHNLPNILSSFIGREKEIAELQMLLRRSRLVVITGAGGMGKTRLALEAVRGTAAMQDIAAMQGIANDFPDGVWLVEFAPLADPALAAATVASALGVREVTGRAATEVVIDFIRSLRMLMIFDNCEHLVDAIARLVDALLQACPALHILATSREILGLPGETVYRCPPLSYVPDTAPEQRPESESVSLFVERAQDTLPSFTLDETDMQAAARICQRLDGIPLAIELAAARVRVLSLDQIEARLDHIFHLLTFGSRAELPRHQTLAALIDWSYNLLSLPERVLLLRLSIFSGGWTLDAAEKICADTHLESRPPVVLPAARILDLLSQLVDKSMVLPLPPLPQAVPLPVRDHEMRYRLLETIRQYARERLANNILIREPEREPRSDEVLESVREEAIRDQHLSYFAELAAQAEPHLRSAGQVQWLSRLEAELDNLRQALEWSLVGRTEDGLRLAAALMWFSHIRQHRQENVEWIERLLLADERTSNQVNHSMARARAMQAAGFLLPYLNRRGESHRMLEESIGIFRGLGPAGHKGMAVSLLFLSNWQLDDEQTPALIQEALGIFREENDKFFIAESMLNLGTHCANRGDLEGARGYWEECLALRKEIKDMDGEGSANMYLGNIALKQAKYRQAEAYLQNAIACFQAVGNKEFTSLMLNYLACTLMAMGEASQAANRLEEAMAIAQAFGIPNALTNALCTRSWLDWSLGEYDQAVQRCEETLAQYRQFAPEGEIQSRLYVLARTALSQGEYEQAGRYLRTLLQSALKINDIQTQIGVIETQAVMAGAVGQARRAAILFGAQEALCPWLLNMLTPRERAEHASALEEARKALGEEGFIRAWAEGQKLSLEEAANF